MEYAAQSAGRYTMLNTGASDTQITNFAQQNLLIGTGNVNFTIVRSTSGSINYVTIQASYTFTFLPILHYNNITVTRKSQVPIS